MSPAPSSPSAGAPDRRWPIALSLLALYLIWGSTYLAIRVALESWPPFLMAAVRFLVAGGLLYGFLRWRGSAAPTRAQWGNAAVTGTLLLGLGNGLVCYAEQSVASGLAAVAVASMPLFAALFGTAYGQRPRRIEWIGLGIGFLGVVLLNLGGGMTGAPAGAAALVVAAAAWAFGSVWSRGRDLPPPLMSTAAQMLTGGVVMLAFGLATGERIAGPPPAVAVAALAYLAVFGSIIGFGAYIWLLNHVRPALATSYAYVNPPIAVLLGALLAGEQVSLQTLVSMAVILSGVVLISRGATPPPGTVRPATRTPA